MFIRVARSMGARMSKQLAQTGKLSLGQLAAPGALSTTMVAVVGLGFLIAEVAILSAQGTRLLAYALIAVFVASTISSIAGFAFSALSGALLFHLLDSPVYAVQVMILCSIGMQLLSVTALWRTIDWRSLAVLLPGGFLGAPTGAYLLLHLPTTTYRDLIGGLLIIYGSYLLLRWQTRPIRTGRLSDACAGFLGGITGGLAGFPGAFVTVWCGLKGWDKTRQRGVYQPFILVMQPATLLAIHLMRPASTQVQLNWNAFAFVPAALLGTWFGLRIFKRLSDRQFELTVNALLIASGIGLIL